MTLRRLSWLPALAVATFFIPWKIAEGVPMFSGLGFLLWGSAVGTAALLSIGVIFSAQQLRFPSQRIGAACIFTANHLAFATIVVLYAVSISLTGQLIASLKKIPQRALVLKTPNPPPVEPGTTPEELAETHQRYLQLYYWASGETNIPLGQTKVIYSPTEADVKAAVKLNRMLPYLSTGTMMRAALDQYQTLVFSLGTFALIFLFAIIGAALGRSASQIVLMLWGTSQFIVALPMFVVALLYGIGELYSFSYHALLGLILIVASMAGLVTPIACLFMRPSPKKMYALGLSTILIVIAIIATTPPAAKGFIH